MAVSATELADVRTCDETGQAAMQKSIPDKAQGENRWFVYSGQIINTYAMLNKGTNAFSANCIVISTGVNELYTENHFFSSGFLVIVTKTILECTLHIGICSYVSDLDL